MGDTRWAGSNLVPIPELIDIRKLNSVLNLDRKTGILEVESGIEWPQLIEWLSRVAKWWQQDIGESRRNKPVLID